MQKKLKGLKLEKEGSKKVPKPAFNEPEEYDIRQFNGWGNLDDMISREIGMCCENALEVLYLTSVLFESQNSGVCDWSRIQGEQYEDDDGKPITPYDGYESFPLSKMQHFYPFISEEMDQKVIKSLRSKRLICTKKSNDLENRLIFVNDKYLWSLIKLEKEKQKKAKGSKYVEYRC